MKAAPALLGTGLLLVCCGCVAPASQHAFISVPGSRARILSAPGATELARMIEELEPLVCADLGTDWPYPYDVRIATPSGAWNAETRTSDRRITIAGDKIVPWRVAHELVHVHCTGRLDHLPGALEEGLAYLVAAHVTGERVTLDTPGPVALRLALTIDYDDYLELDDEDRLAVNGAATWLASKLLPRAAPTLAHGVVR